LASPTLVLAPPNPGSRPSAPLPTVPGVTVNAVSPAAGVSEDKLCKFYQTPRGCFKADKCEFVHLPSQATLQQIAAVATAQAVGAPVNIENLASDGGGRGIGRGRGGRPMRRKLCEFFGTQRGCIKGSSCDFIHQKNQVCSFWASGRGCRKGAVCDFLHSKDGAEVSSDSTSASAPSNPAASDALPSYGPAASSVSRARPHPYQ